MEEFSNLSGMNKKKRMQELRDQGLKHKEIAEKFGVSRQYAAIVC